MTVGVAERYFFEHTAPDVSRRCARRSSCSRAAGANVTEVDLEWPFPGPERFSFYDAELKAAMAQYWPGRRDQLGADIVRDLTASESMTALEAAGWELAKLEYRARARERVEAAGIDLIVTPTQPVTPPKIGEDVIVLGGREVDFSAGMCTLTDPFNALGWPAITVPCGTDAAGMPVGLQIVALPWREADCLAAAAVVESLLS